MESAENAFEDYASIYADAPYSCFAVDAASSLRVLIDSLRITPTSMLDLACGPGDLVIAMSPIIPEVVALDRSLQMIKIAQRRIIPSGRRVGIVRCDMRYFAFGRQFDLITCTFNTLNYLTTEQDLRECLASVAAALASGGHFVFDVYHDDHLRSAVAGRDFVLQNCARVLEVWQNKWLIDNELLQSQVTIFVWRSARWRRLTETHLTRVWRRPQIEALLTEAGLTVLYVGPHLSMDNPPHTTLEERAWYVCRRS